MGHREHGGRAPYGVLRGKQNVPRFFAAWAEIGECTRFEAADFVAAGEHVFNVLHYEFKMRSTGKSSVTPGTIDPRP